MLEATDDTSLALLFPAFLAFRRGLWGEGPAIVTRDVVVMPNNWHCSVICDVV